MSDERRHLVAAAEALADRGRHAEAAQRYRRALAMDPDDARTWRLLAASHLGRREWAEALEAVDEAVRLDPDRDTGHQHRALALARLNRVEEALESAWEAVRCDPDRAENWERLAWQLDAAGQIEAAAIAVEHALELDPSSAEAWVTAGRLAMDRGDFEAAEEHLLRALQLDEANLDALTKLARLASRRQDYQAAIDLARQILRVDPTQRNALMGLAWYLDRLNRRDEAIDLLSACVGASPSDLDYRQELVERLRKSGRDDEAVEVARAAVRSQPDQALSWWCLGAALPPGDPEGLAAAQRAVELDPRSYETWFLLADVLREHGDSAGAVRAISSGAACAPGERWVQERAGRMLADDLGQPNEALPYLDRAVELAPELALTRAQRALAYATAGRYAEALDDARAACALPSTTNDQWWVRVQVALVAGRLEEARDAASRLAASGDEHFAHEAQAMVALVAGDLAGAQQAAEQAVAIRSTCCCARLVGALAAQLPEYDALLAGPTDRKRSDGRCYEQACLWRMRVPA